MTKSTTKNQPLEIVRNTISQIDVELGKAKHKMFCYEHPHGSAETNSLSKKEIELGIKHIQEFIWSLERLKDFVIYKA
jgi:hypothetical protein